MFDCVEQNAEMVFTIIRDGSLRLLRLKSVGVTFAVSVTDKDVVNDDDVDNLVHLLKLTPDLNSDVANWTTVVMEGMRRRLKTR